MPANAGYLFFITNNGAGADLSEEADHSIGAREIGPLARDHSEEFARFVGRELMKTFAHDHSLSVVTLNCHIYRERADGTLGELLDVLS